MPDAVETSPGERVVPPAGHAPETSDGGASAAPSRAVDATDPLQKPDGYPTSWEADVVLRDGSVAHVRPIVPADADPIRVFHRAQSEESVYLRFFAPIKELSDKDVHRFTHVDYVDRVALVVTLRGEIIGIARYDRLADRALAEVAFNISDHYHGKGIGSVLLEHLAVIGQEAGVQQFVAEVLPQNKKMMKVFTDAGYEIQHHFDDGVIAVSFRIEPTDASEAVQLAREHRAEGQSIHGVLTPGSVAVVGVSRRPDAIGSVILDNIVDGGFTGSVYLVNAEAEHVRGLKAYTKVSEIGEPIDLVVIAVPGERVLDVVDDCSRASVRAIVVVSSGFAEAGPEGEQRQADLLARARDAGMRIVGPNSLGLLNNHGDVRLGAVLGRELPPAGNLGLFTQSGGLGVSLLAECARRRLGISTFASAGNRVDVSGNDLMQYWIDDEGTDVVALYLESIGNPRKFSRIARQLALRKPVVAVTSGTSGHVPPGHRARRGRVSPKAFESLLAQAGVIQAESISDLVDIAELVSHQPLPGGTGVAVIGNSDGFNAIIGARCEKLGLHVAHGPIGLGLMCTATEVSAAVESALADPDVHALITCFMPPTRSSDEDIAGAVAHAAWGHEKPCVATFLGMRDIRAVMHRAGQVVGGRRRVVPVYSTPQDGVRALAAAARYARWRSADRGERLRPAGLDRVAAHELVTAVLAEEPAGRALRPDETIALLAAYGVRLWPSVPVAGADEAVAAADRLGYPVVLKAGVDVAHGLAGSVRADLQTEHSVREAYEALAHRFDAQGSGDLLVQRLAPLGVATTVTSHEDPLFGPVVSFGLAGPSSELLDDVVHGIPPLTDLDVVHMIDGLKAAPLLHGYRGAPDVDPDALTDLILRISMLAEEIPEVAQLDLTPAIAHAGGVEVLGADIRIAPAQLRTDAGRRALT